MTRSLRTLLPLFCAMLLRAAAAQAPCDSLNEASFTAEDLGGYTYEFHAVPAMGTSITYTEWGVQGTDFTQFGLAPQPIIQLPGAGDYLACLRATVVDDQQAACQSVHCELLSIPVDSACAALSAAFTIEVDGGSITFVDQSTSDAAITGHAWDFGDGSGSGDPAPEHAYAGAGPYRACLTVSTTTCSATACNWIYLGPVTVPCDTVLQPAIGVIQYEHVIAVFDQSTTSGMSSSVTWDFGDGSSATGSPVLHTYSEDGAYTVCGTVRTWGSLAPDTCSGTACSDVFTFVSAGVDASSAPDLHAFPNPFSHSFSVEGCPPGAHWELVDMLGRTCTSGTTASTGRMTIEGAGLAEGNYLLRVVTSAQVMVLRVVRAGRE